MENHAFACLVRKTIVPFTRTCIICGPQGQRGLNVHNSHYHRSQPTSPLLISPPDGQPPQRGGGGGLWWNHLWNWTSEGLGSSSGRQAAEVATLVTLEPDPFTVDGLPLLERNVLDPWCVRSGDSCALGSIEARCCTTFIILGPIRFYSYKRRNGREQLLPKFEFGLVCRVLSTRPHGQSNRFGTSERWSVRC